MVTLPGHYEFMTDEWRDEARRFLEREVTARRERLQPFSVSERFADAPPHLGFRDDAGAWSLRYDGSGVTVDAAFDPAADVVIEGDYSAALVMAQRVGFGAPQTMAATWREMSHQFGKDAIRAHGQLADPEAGALMADLHDHLARRTMDNPDLLHRATRQGLLRHIREMEEQGFTVIENAISDEFADEVREATLRALSDHGQTTLNWMLYQGREFELLAQQPSLLTLLDASLGRGAVIGSFSAIRKATGPGTNPLHVHYAHVPEPYPEWAMTGVGVWAFEDWTVSAGPTWIVPGSHKQRRAPRPGDDVSSAVPIEMPKGSVVFFTEAVWHWQGDRTDPGERVTLHWHWNRGIARSLEPKKLDNQLLHRNSPRLAEMLGEHDWFDKMHGTGRDYGRFGYMAQLLSFNERQKAKILGGGQER
jgi:ectoine hydroxylase-related dioxygenase (phytanoyl-CoA dioxygenase family)